ncbi:hypothetical protein M5K25_003500 [Dendrobium thyrsiflorum]|uniref:Uncharacterized protein n=1 Tax=Dendrobium thyrsiflorum TaxID=117978 RepID=A0ABD0VJE9_DENTH
MEESWLQIQKKNLDQKKVEKLQHCLIEEKKAVLIDVSLKNYLDRAQISRQNQNYKPNDTKFDSIRAQMGPNQRPGASLEGSNHNLDYQTIIWITKQIERLYETNPMSPRSSNSDIIKTFKCSINNP